jgi:hypothetical protein
MLLGRIKEVKGLGAEISLDDAVKRLDQAADSVEIEQIDKRTESGRSEDAFGDSSERNVPEWLEGDIPGITDRPGAARYRPLRHLAEVAHVSPAAAAIDAWREVEAYLISYLKALDTNVPDAPRIDRSGPAQIISGLKNSKWLSTHEASLLDNLRTTRNAVAHKQTQLSEGQSLAYVDAAGSAISFLASGIWSIKKGEF